MSTELSSERYSSERHSSVLQRLQAAPDSFEFEQLYRLFEQQVYVESRAIPFAVSILSEPLCQGVEIYKVSCTEEGWQAVCHIPSLGGGLGFAPNYLRELSLNQREQDKEIAVRDFYAIFDEPAIARAWKVRVKYDLVIQYEMACRQGKRLRLVRQLLQLAGIAEPRCIDPELLVPYIGLLGCKSRNLASLQKIISSLFQVKVLLRAAPPCRTVLSKDCCTCLNAVSAREVAAGIDPNYQQNRLGHGALIGSACWLDARRLEVLLTVQSRQERIRLSDSKLQGALFELVRLYMGQSTPVAAFLLQPRELLSEPKLSARAGMRLGQYQCLSPGRKPQQLIQLKL